MDWLLSNWLQIIVGLDSAILLWLFVEVVSLGRGTERGLGEVLRRFDRMDRTLKARFSDAGYPSAAAVRAGVTRHEGVSQGERPSQIRSPENPG
jgi:hypothetical protein